VESDLQRYYRIDYRDRWRFDQNSHRLLTLRRIGVLLGQLPPDCAVARAEGSSGRTNVEILLMDLYGATTGVQHPLYPKTAKAFDPEREKRMRAAKVRARERQRAIDAGEIT
jgi:hypothetical protein